MGAFGEKLRKQREQRGITLDAISSVTKINTRMLRALEDEDFDQLPGGDFASSTSSRSNVICSTFTILASWRSRSPAGEGSHGNCL